jgi:hypothetical protein
MFVRGSFSLLIVLATPPALAAGPSTPQEWQRMYDACVQGTGPVAQKMNLGPEYAPAFCSCVRENLQKTAEAERDSKFTAIQGQCMQFAKEKTSSGSMDWPQAGITNFQALCYKQPPKDVPPRSVGAFCACYVQFLPRNVPWREWLLLDLAWKAKGAANLDSKEKGILGRILTVGAYCSEKVASE